MYQKYTTDALVLSSYEIGEADRTFALYTEDFGLVRARATAVRSEKSKMRYALQNYSHASVSLVRGKRGWRLAGAAALKGAAGDTHGGAAFARIAELTVRLVHGEEKNDFLFATLAEAHHALMGASNSAWATIEIVCVARVLFALGYISAEALETALFTHTAYADTHLQEAEVLRDKLLSSINRAISETHL
jgi:recombinational DNA repair protein (RecF pathway)